MNKEEFLKKVIEMSFRYFKETDSDFELAEFSSFLEHTSNKSLDENKKLSSDADDLGIRLVLLNRYAKEYVKIALEDSDLNTADEFSFLITLFAMGSHTKSELTNKMLLTKTSGTEVIKRLLKKGLIKEYEDLEDKRSKRIEINERGQAKLFQVLPRISISSELIKGNLTSYELATLNRLLKKLEEHHKNIFATSSKEDISKHWKI